MLNSPTGHCLDFKSMETCCALSLSPIPPTPTSQKSQAGCSWYVLTLRGNRWMEPHSQYVLLVSTGDRTLTIGPQRPERSKAQRNQEDLHTPQRGASQAPLRSLAPRQLSLTQWRHHLDGLPSC